jgi:hypothetical protein
MFDSSYSYRYINNSWEEPENEGDVRKRVHLLSFVTERKTRYIVRVEQYEESFFCIKYYLKTHSNSKNKYKFLTKENSCIRIIGTCLKIMAAFHRKDPYISFGVIGESSIGEADKETSRYVVYSGVFARFFSPMQFQHVAIPEHSIYLVINKSINAASAVRLDANIHQMWRSHCAAKHIDFEKLF